MGRGFNDQEREGVAACSEGIGKQQVRTFLTGPITLPGQVFGNSQSIVARDRDRAEGLAVWGTIKGT